MLPCLAASGHSLYAKSARLYLQFMLSTQQKEYPNINNNVDSECHVIEVIAPGQACQSTT